MPLMEGSVIDTTTLVTGLTSGANGMVENFINIVGSVIPVALPIIGCVAGIFFVIRLVRNAL